MNCKLAYNKNGFSPLNIFIRHLHVYAKASRRRLENEGEFQHNTSRGDRPRSDSDGTERKEIAFARRPPKG